MKSDLLLVFSIFTLLGLATLISPPQRDKLFSQSRKMWVVDGASLLIQGALVPLLQIVLLLPLWSMVVPEWKSSIALTPWLAFLLNFTVIDYLYYWNHRGLHTERFWPLHRLHHSTTEMGFWVTSRNSLITPIAIVYLWSNSLATFVLNDPIPFLMGAAASASLDLWRHSSFFPMNSQSLIAPGLMPRITRMIEAVFITPRDHAWHHSSDVFSKNFGANLSIWDRWHGTLYRPGHAPEKLGAPLEYPILVEFIWPFARSSRNTLAESSIEPRQQQLMGKPPDKSIISTAASFTRRPSQ